MSKVDVTVQIIGGEGGGGGVNSMLSEVYFVDGRPHLRARGFSPGGPPSLGAPQRAPHPRAP